MGRKQAKGIGKELIELPLENAQDVPEQLQTLNKVITIANLTVGKAIENKDPAYALACIKGEFHARHSSDVSAIQLCYQTQKRWGEFGLEGDFLDYAQAEVQKGAETIRRYAKIGRMMNECVPTKYRATLWCRPIRNLVSIAQAVDEHGNFDDGEWHKLSQCVNGQEVRTKLEEFLAKERKPTNRLVITLDREGGLKASRRGKSEPIGALRLEPENPLVAEAVQRIIASAGILEK